MYTKKSVERKIICLVTWQGGGNYGTCLQSFSLHKKLQMLGYFVCFLHPFREPFSIKSKVIDIMLKIGLYNLLRQIKYGQSLKLRKRYNFYRKGYNIVYVNTKKQKERLLSTMDVFLTGSDQIWNTYYKYDPFFFLDFVTNGGKCISYASSIGTNCIAEPYKALLRKSLDKFQHISLREKTGVDVINNLLDKNKATQVIDPTLLLTNHEWRNICKDARLEIDTSVPYVLCYLVGNNRNYERQIENITKKLGLSHIIEIPAIESYDNHVTNDIRYEDAGPLEFVKLIEQASIVITDSFHATVFSINFSKDFIVLERFKNNEIESQNSRIYDVLNHYGLGGRIYHAESNSWIGKIDFSEPQRILEEDRKKSTDYLINAIEN